MKKMKKNLRAGTSEQEVYACAVVTYCLLPPDQRTYEAFSSAMHPRGIYPPPDCIVGNTIVQFDSKFYHEQRVTQDELTSASHAKEFEVVRIRDRLPPLDNADVNIRVDCSKGGLRGLMGQLWVHFETPPDRIVEEWIRAYLLELSVDVEGRSDGREWLSKALGTYKPKWNTIPFEKEGVGDMYKAIFETHGRKALLSIMETSLYEGLHDNARLREWLDELGPERFCTFMCGGVASKLLSKAFNARLREWLDKLGPERFCTFMRDGVAARIMSDGFGSAFDRMAKEIGVEATITIFSAFTSKMWPLYRGTKTIGGMGDRYESFRNMVVAEAHARGTKGLRAHIRAKLKS